MIDKMLFLYLENFKIKKFDQHEVLKRKCSLCRRQYKCCTLTFEHIKSGYTLVRPMCDYCADQVRLMYHKLRPTETIDA